MKKPRVLLHLAALAMGLCLLAGCAAQPAAPAQATIPHIETSPQHLLGFALAHEAVVNVDAGQAVADGLINQRRRDGGVHAAGKSQQHRALVAHDFADVGNRRLRVGFHRPVAHAAADIQEVFDDRAPLVGVGHFRMELHAVDALVVVRHRRNGAVRAVRNRVETSRALLHLIGMAQPAGGSIRHAGEQARLIVHRHGDSAILALCRLFHRYRKSVKQF